jgi:hypothetical protein
MTINLLADVYQHPATSDYWFLYLKTGSWVEGETLVMVVV